MARVNHKRVKQLLNEKRSRITDRQFFTSRILAGHFEDMAMAQTRRYKYNRRIHVAISWSPKSGEVACTNNLSVLINAGHRLVTQNRGRENRYEIVCGLFAHELGHCLYTDFLAGQTYNNYLSREKWYPEPPAYKLPKDTVNERALWEYDKPPTMADVKPALALESLARIYGASQPGLPPIEFPAKYEKALRQIAQLQGKISDCNAEIKTYEKEIAAHSVRIAELMQAHEHGVLSTTGDKLLIDFVTRTTKRPDSKLLKEKYPAVYADVLKTSESRKLKVSVTPT